MSLALYWWFSFVSADGHFIADAFNSVSFPQAQYSVRLSKIGSYHIDKCDKVSVACYDALIQ